MKAIIILILLFLTSCSVPVGILTKSHVIGTRVDELGTVIEQIEIHSHSLRNQVLIGPDGPQTLYGSIGDTFCRIDKEGNTRSIDFFNFQGERWFFEELLPLKEYGYWFGLIQVGELYYDRNRYAEDKVVIIFDSERILHRETIPGCLRLVTRGEEKHGDFRVVTPFWKPLRNDISSRDDLNWKISIENSEALFSTTSGILKFDLTSWNIINISEGFTPEIAEAEFERQIINYLSEKHEFFENTEKLFGLAFNAEFALDNGFPVTAKMYGEIMRQILSRYETRLEYFSRRWGESDRHALYMTLGRISMLDNDVESAELYLLKAGKTGCPRPLSAEGPDMRLANQLIETGNKQTVIEYLEGIKRCWQEKDNTSLWVTKFESGTLPDSESTAKKSSGYLGQFIHVVQSQDSMPILRVNKTYQTENDSGIAPLLTISDKFSGGSSGLKINDEPYDFYSSDDNNQFIKVGTNFGPSRYKFEFNVGENYLVYSSSSEYSFLRTTFISVPEKEGDVPILLYILIDNYDLGSKYRTIKVIFHQKDEISGASLNWRDISLLTDFQINYINKFISAAKSAFTLHVY